MSALRANPAVGWLAGAASVVVAFLVIGIVAHVVSPTPSGPGLSSYATTPSGVAAWAELLSRDGHSVRQLRKPVAATKLPANATLVILSNGTELASSDAVPLQHFLNRGGRVILGGQAVAIAPMLRGDLIVVTSPGFLENAALASADNAARSLAIAGATARPVYFDETVHGYGPATGLAAFPRRWWFAIVAFGLALAVWTLSRAARLGGSDPLSAPMPSPRNAYIDAMAQTLVRAASRDELLREVRLATDRETTFRESL
jgi:hypothetical protein